MAQTVEADEPLRAAEGLLFGLGDVLQDAADVAGRQAAGVAFVVEQHQPAGPMLIACSGAILTEARARDLADEVEEPKRRRRGHSDCEWGRHRLTPWHKGVLGQGLYTRTQGEARKTGAGVQATLTIDFLRSGMAEVRARRALEALFSTLEDR
jgi:hypothetical protein